MIKDKTQIPFIRISDATCDFIKQHNYKKVLIFATKFTMKNGLYSNALTKMNIDWILPNEEDIEILGDIIYPNLENGIIIEKDKQKMISIAEKYIKLHSADSILLGCTEIPLMIKPNDVSIPVINKTKIHIEKICEAILQ